MYFFYLFTSFLSLAVLYFCVCGVRVLCSCVLLLVVFCISILFCILATNQAGVPSEIARYARRLWFVNLSIFCIFVSLYFLYFGHKSSRGFPVKLLNLPADYDLWSVGVINCTGHATECATPNITHCSSSIKMDTGGENAIKVDTGVKNAIKRNAVVKMLQKRTQGWKLQKEIQGWNML